MEIIKHLLVVLASLLLAELPKAISNASGNATDEASIPPSSTEISSNGSTDVKGVGFDSFATNTNVSYMPKATADTGATSDPGIHVSSVQMSKSKEMVEETLLDFLENSILNDVTNSSKFTFQTLGISLFGINYLGMIKRMLVAIDMRQILPKTDDVSSSCYEDIMAFVDGLVGIHDDTDQSEYVSMDWAIQMLDAFGKPTPGMLTGALQFVGNYDQCLETRAKVPTRTNLREEATNQTTREFGARYCRVRFPVGQKIKLTLPVGTNKFWTNQKNIPININWGICVPESCHRDDVMAFLKNGTLGALSLHVEDAVCFEEVSLVDDRGAIATLCIIGVFFTVILTCTVLDVYLRNRPWFSSDNAIDRSDRDVVFDVIELQHINNVTYDYEVQDPTDDVKDTDGLHDPEVKVQQNGGEKVNLDNSTKLSSGSPRISQQVTVNANGKADVSTQSRTIILESSTKETTPEVCGAENGVGGNKIHTCRVKEKQKSRGEQLVQGFSSYTSMLHLLSTERSSGSFDCIQGLRVVSMAWIVLGHCYTFGGCLDETNILFTNPLELVKTPSRLSFHIVGSAHLAVDTFFVISGCLVMIFTLRALERSQPNVLFWVTFFFHRFWRLTPVYMMAMTLGTTLYDHIVQGPLKADKFEEFYKCKDKWWSHLLYFNNFYKPEDKCMTWTWFMAVDMQLYVLSPILIYPVYRNLKFGIGLIVSFFFLVMAAAFIAEYRHGGQFVLMDLSFLEYWSYVYTMPWARAGAFTVGLLLGVVLHRHKGRRPIMSKPKAFLIWTLVVSLAIFLVLINHHQWKLNSEHWSRVTQSFYEALVRPLWAICIAWVVYSCSTGLGGIAYDILSWSPFLVLSRLCYSVYLIHPVVIMFVAYSRRTPIYLHPAFLSLTYSYIGNLVLSYLFATVLYLTFEVPMMSLERIFLRGR